MSDISVQLPEALRKSRIAPTGFGAPVSQRLPEVVRRIVEALNPEKIILFGSYAHGNPTPDSDVDLLVIMETDLPVTERYLRVSNLLYPRPFPVDILVKTPQEVERAMSSADAFIREIVSKGCVLYERSR